MGCLVTQEFVPFLRAIGNEFESVDERGSVDCEDDGGSIGVVGRGRLAFTCNKVGAVKGMTCGKV